MKKFAGMIPPTFVLKYLDSGAEDRWALVWMVGYQPYDLGEQVVALGEVLEM